MHNLLTILAAIVRMIGYFFLLEMTFVVGLQVFARYVLNASLTWPEEMARYSFLVMSFLAIANVEYKKGHLRVDAIKNYTGPKMHKFLDIFSDVLSFSFYVICLYLTYNMTLLVYDMAQQGIGLPIPIWTIWASMVISLALTLIISIMNNILNFNKHTSSEK